jgi:nucleotide-binding universal stress UspA family protein
MTGPVLVATDGRPVSLGAVRLAHLVAERMGVPLSVLAVLEPVPFEAIDPGYPILSPVGLVDEERADALQLAVHDQLRAATAREQVPSVHVETGAPAATIVDRAREIGASLIVIGQRRHSTAERWLGADTSLKTVSLAHVPVLVVPPEVRHLPERAVVGVDFSDFSIDAARIALAVLGDRPALHLVHVTWTLPGTNAWEDDVQWTRTYIAGAAARLAELRDELGVERSFGGESLVVSGDPCSEILRQAEHLGAELVAVGSHGYGFLGRLVTGSVSSRLLRRADRLLLVAPPREAAGVKPAGVVGRASAGAG